MANMTDYLEGQIRAHCFRTASFTKPAALWIRLWLDTATINDASTGSTAGEVSGGAYAAVQRDPLDANWTAPDTTGGLTDNAADITFTTATANWGIVRYVGICDAATAGNMLFWGQLTADKTVNNGDTFKFATGALDITFA